MTYYWDGMSLDHGEAFFYDITETMFYKPRRYLEGSERVREIFGERGLPVPSWAQLGPQQESSPPPPAAQPFPHALVATGGQEPPPGEPLALDESMPQPSPPSPEQETPTTAPERGPDVIPEAGAAAGSRRTECLAGGHLSPMHQHVLSR